LGLLSVVSEKKSDSPSSEESESPSTVLMKRILTQVGLLLFGMGTYSRIGPLVSYRNLQSYWTTTKLWKLTVVLGYYEAMETYSRIGLLRSFENMQSHRTTTMLRSCDVSIFRGRSKMDFYRRFLLLDGNPIDSWVGNTLETSGEDVKLHSKRVEKIVMVTLCRSLWLGG
jgi:hypothetical protein